MLAIQAQEGNCLYKLNVCELYHVPTPTIPVVLSLKHTKFPVPAVL